MKAMILRRQQALTAESLVPVELPLPDPAPDELLVKVHVCGVCRTDLHILEGDLAAPGLPLILGHQTVGTVVRCGSSCSRFTAGARVGIAWLRGACGSCRFCTSGRENLCDRQRFTGFHDHGGYAEHTLVPEAFAYPIPERFSDAEAAPLLCAGIIGFRALRRTQLQAGARLMLYGFGSSAHVTLQIAKHFGCEVFVATRGKRHAALAESLGADWVGAAEDDPPQAADAAIVFAPVGAVLRRALETVGKGGIVVSAGIHMTPVPELSYEKHLFHEKMLTSVAANTRDDGEALLRIAAEVPVRPQVSLYPLAAANEALLALKAGRLNGTAVLEIG